ncbi:MAG: AAA family ATPase [Armatimonadetes bacterium]|nr:AAA family ATPase [Armatimonadota bacterium]
MGQSVTHKVIAAHLLDGRLTPGEEFTIRIDDLDLQSASKKYGLWLGKPATRIAPWRKGESRRQLESGSASSRRFGGGRLVKTHGGGQVSERRVVAVLFADIAGFTAMAERLDPETVTDVINEIFTMLGREVEAVGGHVDKVVGDEVMALFGAPVAHEDDALRAVRAALAMHRAMAARKDALQRMVGQVPRLRIGIHCGQVIWGVVGPPGREHPTVMGDVVNVASRLQRAAPEDGVLVSEEIWRQVRGACVGKAWEPIAVKGKAEPVAAYEVLGEREHTEPMHRPPFVNRQQDLEQLDDLFGRARRGRAQVVVVTGDPGIGKSRLVEEFTLRLPEGVPLLRTGCPPYAGESLGPLADLFRQFTGLAGPVTVADVAARIPLGDRAHQAAAVLCRLFGLAEVDSTTAPAADDFSPETALLMAAESIRRMLTRPTVVWIENVEWADAATREVLPTIVERMNDTPLLMVGTMRAGDDPIVWGRRTPVTTLQLEPLADEDARVLLAEIAGDPLPDEIARILIAKAAGNPFYLSEIVATLRGQGLLVQDHRGHWRAAGALDQVLPDTIQGALLARLDRLTPNLRTVVQRAAVLGTSVRQSLLAVLCPAIDMPASLRALEDAYLMRRRDPLAADPEYTFVYPLLREVAYNNLLHKHQASIHRQAAEAMERLYPGEAEDLAKTIGTHYDRGGDPRQALPYLLQAARQATRRYAMREAIELLERARDLCESTGQTELCAEAQELLGEIYPRVQEHGPEKWLAAWEYVLAHTDPRSEPVRYARAAIRAAEVKALKNRFDDAWAMLDGAASLIPPDHPMESELHRGRAVALTMQSRYREAAQAARMAVEVANRRGTLLDRSRAYGTLSHPALMPLLGEEGTRMIRQWVNEAEAAGDDRVLINASVSLVTDIWTRGTADEEFLRVCAEGLRRTQDLGWTHDEAKLRVLLGWALVLLGRWDEAEAHVRRAREVVEAHGGNIYGTLILLHYVAANLAMVRGRLDEAREIFEDALGKVPFHAPIWLNHDLARCHLMRNDLAAAHAAMERSLGFAEKFRCIVCGNQAHGVAAEFYAALGEGERAAPLAEDAETTAREIGHLTTLIRVQRARSHLALHAGRVADAVLAAHAAVEMGRQRPLPQPFEDGQSWWLLGSAQRAAGEHEGSVASWREAARRFEALGAAWHVRQVTEALSRAGAAL